MSPAPHPSSDRATRKVRDVAERHRQTLGELRHVESCTLSARAIGIVAGIFALVVAVVAFNGQVIEVIVFALGMGLVLAVILRFVASEKLLVLDRGLVVGSFGPFMTPYAVPYADVVAPSVSAIVGTQRPVSLLKADQGASATNRTALWSLRSVTFVGPTAGDARAFTRTGQWQPRPERQDLWVFSVRDSRRQEILVHELAAALHRSGQPGAERIVAHALPARRLRVTVADADHLRLPHRLRSTTVQVGHRVA
jgi:tetrahydromethanopterin S-methyltransferase subunit F